MHKDDIKDNKNDIKPLSALITEKAILSRITSIGDAISVDYKDRDLMIIGILKGASIFVSDLIRGISIPLKYDFIRLSSYPSAKKQNKVSLIWDLPEYMVRGKDIIIADTIYDSGVTLSFVLEHITKMQPASIEFCVLLNKLCKKKKEIHVKYKGFDVEDSFVVGYGLDIDDKYRHLPYIAKI